MGQVAGLMEGGEAGDAWGEEGKEGDLFGKDAKEEGEGREEDKACVDDPANIQSL